MFTVHHDVDVITETGKLQYLYQLEERVVSAAVTSQLTTGGPSTAYHKHNQVLEDVNEVPLERTLLRGTKVIK